MKKQKKVILELKKERIVSLSKVQSLNIKGGYAKTDLTTGNAHNPAGLTTLNVCLPETGTHTSRRASE